MKLNNLLTVASIYMAIVGLGFILFPEAFGRGALPTEVSSTLISYLRLWGSPLIGIAVLDWLVRNEAPSKALNAIIIGNVVGFAVMTLLDALGVLNDARPVTKVFVVVHLLFTLAFIAIGKKSFLKNVHK